MPISSAPNTAHRGPALAFEINHGGNVSLFLNHAIVKMARASPKEETHMEQSRPLTNRSDFDLGPARNGRPGWECFCQARPANMSLQGLCIVYALHPMCEIIDQHEHHPERALRAGQAVFHVPNPNGMASFEVRTKQIAVAAWRPQLNSPCGLWWLLLLLLPLPKRPTTPTKARRAPIVFLCLCLITRIVG